MTLELEGPRTVGALRTGRLAVRVRALVPLAGLRVSVVARELGREGTAVYEHSTPLPPLPALIRGTDPIWERLTLQLSGLRAVLLEVRVGGLTAERWTLDVEDSAAWGEQHRAPEDDATERAWFDARRPWSSLPAPPDGAVALIQPLRASTNGAVFAALGGGMVTRRGAVVLGERLVVDTPKRLLRRLDAERDGRVGALELVTAWLCWASAGAPDLLAATDRDEVVRTLDRWTGAALCGPAWADAEQELARLQERLGAPFGAQVVDALWARGLCRDPEIERQLGPELTQRAREAMVTAIKDSEGWGRRLLTEGRAGELAAALDEVANDAYARAAGGPVDADAGSPDAEVAEVLGALLTTLDRARSAAHLSPLLLPRSTAAAVASIDPELSREDQVTALVDALRARPEGVPWPARAVELLLSVWVDPSRVRLGALPEVLSSALEDRGAARLVRFVAVRRRAALGLSL